MSTFTVTSVGPCPSFPSASGVPSECNAFLLCMAGAACGMASSHLCCSAFPETPQRRKQRPGDPSPLHTCRYLGSVPRRGERRSVSNYKHFVLGTRDRQEPRMDYRGDWGIAAGLEGPRGARVHVLAWHWGFWGSRFKSPSACVSSP